MNPLEKFDKAVACYLHDLRYKRTSGQTIRNYETRLDLFRSFWKAEYQPSVPKTDPTYADISAWRDFLTDSGKTASTVKQYLKELSQFFKAMNQPVFAPELRYPENPVSEYFYPKVEKRPYDMIMCDDDVALLLKNQAPVSQAKHYWARNYAIVMLLLCTKIRNAELLSLRLCDLDFENAELVVERGKGGKFRVCEFQPLAQSAVRLYLESGLRPKNLCETDLLFGTTSTHSYGEFTGNAESWHRGTSQWLSSLVERHIKSVTGISDVRTHDLRHIGARLNLNSGASMEYLQSQLGHASMATTQIYSGRLMQRRSRISAQGIMAQMENQAKINNTMLVNPFVLSHA